MDIFGKGSGYRWGAPRLRSVRLADAEKSPQKGQRPFLGMHKLSELPGDKNISAGEAVRSAVPGLWLGGHGSYDNTGNPLGVKYEEFICI